jgi:UDP-glucose 4-epimerase
MMYASGNNNTKHCTIVSPNVKALIVGGAGFIGSHLVEQLVKQGVSTTVYDNLSSGNAENLVAVQSDIRLILADIRNLDTLLSAMRGVDCVFHLAALTSVSQSILDPLLTQEINTTGTLNVLWSAVKAGVSRVVIASSCAIYGDAHQPPLKEADLPAPKSPYAASKLTAEALAESFYHAYGLETVCLRYFNVYGDRQKPDSDYAAVIPRFIQCYRNRQPPQIYGDGLQSRDFIHVTDVAKANLLAASLPSNALVTARVFNVGSGTSTSLLELLQIMSRQAGYKLNPEFREARKGDVINSCADCTLATKKLGFNCSVNLNQGIKHLLDSAKLS